MLAGAEEEMANDRLSPIYLTKAWVGGRRKSWDGVKE
jgi:hypothetical protein